MRVGEVVNVEVDGRAGVGRVEAVRAGRAFVRLTVSSPVTWTSPLTGGTVPAGCPVSYVLSVDVGALTAG